MHTSEQPYIIDFDAFGATDSGFLFTTQAADKLPFAVKRVFWVTQVPNNYSRGQHAGYTTQEVIVAVQGRILVQTETVTGQKEFTLDHPSKGLFVPGKCWIKLSFSENAMLLCLASSDYDPADYIEDYTEFKRICSLTS